MGTPCVFFTISSETNTIFYMTEVIMNYSEYIINTKLFSINVFVCALQQNIIFCTKRLCTKSYFSRKNP